MKLLVKLEKTVVSFAEVEVPDCVTFTEKEGRAAKKVIDQLVLDDFRDEPEYYSVEVFDATDPVHPVELTGIIQPDCPKEATR